MKTQDFQDTLKNVFGTFMLTISTYKCWIYYVWVAIPGPSHLEIEWFNLYFSKSFGSHFNKIAQKHVQVISGIELNNETL